jgi:heme/copper-type cytochrome/quinol oxidase subunit 3
VYMSGPSSQSWWAMVVLMLVAASIFACAIFSYLFLWTVSPELWRTALTLPPVLYPLTSAALLCASTLGLVVANRMLRRDASFTFYAALTLAIVCMTTAFGIDLAAHMNMGLRPDASGYGALVYLFVALHGFYGLVVIAMALYTLARRIAGKLDAVRRVTFDNTRLFWHYTVAQSLVGLALIHGFPRVVG